MDLPLCAVEVILGSGGLRVDSEDDVFDFILKWARAHYPKLEERREILTKCLMQCICFQCINCLKLKEVLVCPDFDHEKVPKLVLEALCSKGDVSCSQSINTSTDLATTHCSFLGRIYKLQPIKVVQLAFSQPRCVVYFDLKREECENLFPSRKLDSPPFRLGGQCFYLSAQHTTKEQQNSFGLFVRITKESESCSLDYKFSVIKKSSTEFQSKGKGKANYSNLKIGFGHPNIFLIPWTDFIAKDSEYVIDEILHLRADLIINNSQA